MSDAGKDYILIVEPDADTRGLLEAYFSQTAEFGFYSAQRGDEAIQIALQQRPALILTETQLPDKAGLAVFRELKQYPRTAYIPFIFLGGGRETLLQNQILEAGAYDFIIKSPLDPQEVALRVRNTLRRTRYEGELNPLTRLPTQIPPLDSLRIDAPPTTPDQEDASPVPKTILRIMLNHFAAFQEVHGFVAANEVLSYVANALCDVLDTHKRAHDFIGQPDDSEFIIVTAQAVAPTLNADIQVGLTEPLAQFHSFIEREQGFVELTDQDGHTSQHPLMTLSIGQQSYGAS